MAEAMQLAIEALNEAADKHYFEARMGDILKDDLPAAARRGLERRVRLLEAMEVLQKSPLAWPSRERGPDG